MATRANIDRFHGWAIACQHEAAMELCAITVMLEDDLVRMIGPDAAAMVVDEINARLNTEEKARGRA
jgi:hypothetical protein